MDTAHKSDCKFPAYTTAELRAAYAIASRQGEGERCETLMNEIARREAGVSKPFTTPQI